MIQRVQSIFLFIAIIIPIVLIFIPFGKINTVEYQYVYDSISLKLNINDGESVLRLYYLAFCLFLTSVLSGIALFTYKNRIKQMQIVSLTMIVFLITLMLILWICPEIVFKKFFEGKTASYELVYDNKGIPLIIMITIEAICLFLANRFIKKDEKHVRDCERLR